MTIAYLANEFPCSVEPYVTEEIEELRGRGIRVVAGSVRAPRTRPDNIKGMPEVVVQSAGAVVLARAVWLCLWKWKRLVPLLTRVAFHGTEACGQRIRALLHTFLGACYAAMLNGREVHHIHVHHGYFGSWIAMTAARLLDVGFSLTVHGSDLLLNGTYLDAKLANCSFCLTISEYNRSHILKKYPTLDPRKIVVSRLGVDVADPAVMPGAKSEPGPLRLRAVGRLHEVKDHAFLVRACAEMHSRGLQFNCLIAGEGPERSNLESLIQECGVSDEVALAGHIPREQLGPFYDSADLVVLTSRSEGIPLVLMEAMARGKLVLAPAITGIPELVIAGKTGFLYEPGSVGDFVAAIFLINSLIEAQHRWKESSAFICAHSASGQLDEMAHSAQLKVRQNFNRSKNLEIFGDLFVARISAETESRTNENFVLQQI